MEVRIDILCIASSQRIEKDKPPCFFDEEISRIGHPLSHDLITKLMVTINLLLVRRGSEVGGPNIDYGGCSK